MLVPNRFHRALPLVVLVAVGLFLFAAIRLRHASAVESTLYHVINGGDKPAPTNHATPATPATPAESAASPSTSPAPKEPARLDLAPNQCRPEVELLRDRTLGLSDTIRYSRKCVEPVLASDTDRDAVTKLNTSLIPAQAASINLTSCTYDELPPCETISLQVPKPYPSAQYPHLVFGISTSYERVNDSLPAFAHWLKGSGSKLVAVVVDAEKEGEPAKDLRALEKLYRAQDVELKAVVPRNKTLKVDQNHFAMLADVVEAADNQTRWLGILDDDTFFPSLYTLSEALDRFDHTKSMWLGQLSEDFEAMHSWGFMAFGGAGAFLSMSLANELVPHIPRCLVEARLQTGDCILRDCIYDHTRTKLTLVPGLYQHDFMGDVSGFYEAGLSPLSLHHWKSWYRAPVARMAKAAHFCGACFLQRFQFGSDTLLANGYSITQYAKGLQEYDLMRMEQTWQNPGPKFEYYIGPLRDKIDQQDKKSWRLVDSGPLASGGGLRQVYVHKGDEELEEPDDVIEMIWEG
ncbi:uncharacterized protein E0L32_011031 [Thyridium curvatum]|uniref:Glycosyltransferase family 31 protein n=1 Tax=Thyridium curvatum TaxID=1093900 RepID=A0A507AIM3_9PEZI|nr:uncharacterized protein E0L32_011031 [Thyridium curvatum]TPX07043.1 hypothetical protein E0L32_011031 [Thyridium curvatum]